jgi:ElaB/YqjD/DUF883 family membrane-anchored ribosome-binding protein
MTQQRADYPLDYTAGPAGTTARPASHAAHTVADQVKGAADDVQEFAGKMVDQALEYGEKAQDAARNIKPFMEKSLKEQPLATLAAIAVVGFALGALWKK